MMPSPSTRLSLAVLVFTLMTPLISATDPLRSSHDVSKSETSLHWGLESIEARRAWTTMRLKKEILIAVIDTGVDLEHPDLRGKIWLNPGESGRVDSPECRNPNASGALVSKDGTIVDRCDKARNGIDDDGNGFVDDVHGWNFATDAPEVFDDHGHGTHVAGIVASGESGVSPHAKLMILKYLDPKGARSGKQNPILATAKAIRYAVKMGASIINYSAGGPSPSEIERQAVLEALRAGVLIIAASGNDGRNTDRAGYYPADYGLDNVLPVTAVDPGGKILRSSNFGVRLTRIAAPGENIRSSVPGNKHSSMTGTSQATAFVTGAAALLLANEPQLDRRPQDTIRRLILSGDVRPSLERKTRHQATLNAFRALAMRDSPRDPLSAQLERLHEFTRVLHDKSTRGLSSQSPTRDALRMKPLGIDQVH